MIEHNESGPIFDAIGRILQGKRFDDAMAALATMIAAQVWQAYRSEGRVVQIAVLTDVASYAFKMLDDAGSRADLADSDGMIGNVPGVVGHG